MGAFVSVQSGAEATCALDTEGTIHCYGAKFEGGQWVLTDDKPVALEAPAAFASFAMGRAHLCALTDVGRAYCFGENWSGQPGTGASGEVDRFEPVDTPLRFEAIFAGNDYSCALSAEGEGPNAYCWGSGSDGKLGAGSEDDEALPTPIPGHRFEALALSRDEDRAATATCGIDEAGRVLCWGANDTGQLGDGTTEGSLLPKPVALAGRFTAVSLVSMERPTAARPDRAGHACALRDDGAIFCWGSNRSLQVTPEAVEFTPDPVEIAGGPYRAVAVGSKGPMGLSCGLATSGVAYCWGSGEVGGAYGADPLDHEVPTEIGVDLRLRSFDLAAARTCGIDTEGKASCWGRSFDPDEASMLAPVLLRGQSF